MKEWVADTDDTAGLTLEYPKGWKADQSEEWLPDYLADKAAVLSGYKGTGGSIYLCAANFDTEDLSAGADRIANIFQSASGNTYSVTDNEVYFIWDDNKKADQSCILIHPVKPLTIDGKKYNFLLVWAPKDYNSHVLKTMKLDSSPLKIVAGTELQAFTTDLGKYTLAFDVPTELSTQEIIDGEGIGGLPKLLADDAQPYWWFTGETGSVEVVLYDPGTEDIGKAAAKLSSTWAVDYSTKDLAGNSAIVLKGSKPAPSSLIILKLPKPVEMGMKNRSYAFLVLRVVNRTPEQWITPIIKSLTVK